MLLNKLIKSGGESPTGVLNENQEDSKPNAQCGVNMYRKIYNGQFMPYEAILLKGHLDENEVREALEDELGDKDHVERLMSREPIHTYGKPLPHGVWWLTPEPEPKQKTTPITILG